MNAKAADEPLTAAGRKATTVRAIAA